jgi:hypothetical protein
MMKVTELNDVILTEWNPYGLYLVTDSQMMYNQCFPYLIQQSYTS